ncbi:MAG: trigger factor [Opitutaceae bacterium]
MNIKINDLTVNRKSIVVTLEPKEVDATHQTVVNQFSQKAQLPGFRPGKAPAAIVIKRFGKDIAEEFRQNVINAAYRAISEREDLKIAAYANVEISQVEVGKESVITLTVDIQPDFQMPEYSGLPTEIAPIDASDKEIEAVIEGIRAERADFKAADRPAQKGDFVKLGYEGKVEGKPISEIAPDRQVYGKIPQTWEEVEGAHEGIIPSLGKHLAGLRVGDKKDVTVQFPLDFAPLPVLAGKTAVYSIDIQEVRERILPAIDEEFLKANKAESLDALKKSIGDSLKTQKEMQNRNAQRRQVVEQLNSLVEFALPEALVENETQNVLRQFVTENMRRGVPQEQLEKDKQEIFENARKAAAQRVKSQFIIAQIAEKEKIAVSESDFDAFLYRESMRTGGNPEKILKDLAKDRELLRSVQRTIIFDKAVDFLISKATVSIVQPKA